MTAKFVREDVVHFGNQTDEHRWRVYFLCERARLMSALYGGPGHDAPPMYMLGIDTFHTSDDVDCMTCLVLEARRGTRS